MLTEYVHDHARDLDRELRAVAQSRPRYDRAAEARGSRMRELLRSLAYSPVGATPGRDGAVAAVLIRPAVTDDARSVARLAEASERRLPSGLVLVAEIEQQLVAALPVDAEHVLTDLRRPTGDVVQLLELRSEQLRAAVKVA